jgi:hypothetical protein
MTLSHRILIVLAVFVECTLSTNAQWRIEGDSSFGNNGIGVDATAFQPSVTDYPVTVFITKDGSAYTVRKSTSLDTTVVVGRVMKNGQSDPLFDLDGVMSLKTSANISTFLLSTNDLMWFGETRAGRFEMTEIDRLGRMRSTPFWQDTALYTTNQVFGIRNDETIVMYSNRWNDPDGRWYLRYLRPGGVLPVSDVFVQPDPTPADFTLHNATLDAKGRLIVGKPIADRSFAIGRYTPDGVLDEEFGNAMGLLTLEIPAGSGAQISNVMSIRNGGYVIVLSINERITNNTTESFIRLVRIDDRGQLISTFGNDGVLDIRGSLMESRGIVECPNGDILFASFGTYAYSHLYQISADGTIIPRQWGGYTDARFELIQANRLITLTDNGYLYATSLDPSSSQSVVSRFRVDAVTSASDASNHTPLAISIDHGVVSVKGASTSTTVRLYSLVGQCVFEQQCNANGSVALPSMMSGTYMVSATTDREVKSSVVNVVR